MTTREHLIKSLRRLCDDNGGYRAVADKAGVDDQSLYQIISGVKLPSGNAKGVGPTIQRKLDAAFPGWSGTDQQKLGTEVREDQATYGSTQWPFRHLQPSVLRGVSLTQLAAIEQVISAVVEGMTPASAWRQTARALATELDLAIKADSSFDFGSDPFSKFVLQVDERFAAATIEQITHQQN